VFKARKKFGKHVPKFKTRGKKGNSDENQLRITWLHEWVI
jgi:hypothetical protein